ncbi:MAG: DevR family CRISPR-associated autoregulator [candidate division WOR-3 bacterium]|nr:DevR family CRISPR-associated autoregulator [candidate division WOR-3 bacterium]
MLKFVTFAVKLQLNVHDLNNEACTGNVTDIRVIDFLNENGEKVEAPAVSGRMLKHWHYELLRNLGIQNGLSFCDACKIGEPVRPAILKDRKLLHEEAVKKGHSEIVKTCAICDIHGFLAAVGETSERRSSRVMFSWLLPTLDSVSVTKQVIHSRVKSGIDFEDEKLTSQMPFNKSYASGIYGFVSAFDVDRVGLIELNLGKNISETKKEDKNSNPEDKKNDDYVIDKNSNPEDKKYVIKADERQKRIKLAIEAYRHLISGKMGASLSHAIPHVDPIEILVVYSETGPLPFPVSPIYSDYIKKTMGLVPQDSKCLFWSKDQKKVEGKDQKEDEGIDKVNSINDLFGRLLDKVR